MASFFERVREKVERRISRRVLRAVASLFAVCVLLMVLGGTAATFEYRTNWIAKWVGNVLADTNTYRRAAGGVWAQLRARAEVQGTFEGEAAVFLPEGGEGLPEAVSGGRFEMERVPETGMPGFVAVWRTPVGSEAQRDVPELVESLRIFRAGLALLEAAAFPDVRYRGRVRQEVAALYRQVGGADEVTEVYADSVKAAVAAELAREITDRLRREEQAVMRKGYRAGRVGQVLLQRGLGRYEGEISYHDPEIPGVSFEVAPEQIARIFKVDIPEDEP